MDLNFTQAGCLSCNFVYLSTSNIGIPILSPPDIPHPPPLLLRTTTCDTIILPASKTCQKQGKIWLLETCTPTLATIANRWMNN